MPPFLNCKFLKKSYLQLLYICLKSLVDSICSGEHGEIILNLQRFLFLFEVILMVGWKILVIINIYIYFAQKLNFDSYLQSKSQTFELGPN